jgi:soluble cytochrome b562
VSTDQDQARLIAERVARRVAGNRVDASNPPAKKSDAPVSQELSAIREGLHDLEHKLDSIESKIVHGPQQPAEPSRARLIDFVSSGPPLVVSPSIAQTSSISQTSHASPRASTEPAQFVPATHSPWVRDFNTAPDHPSQERFGVEEATVAELVEFFESEKKCSVEPGGKPCDHCAMCSSRGF